MFNRREFVAGAASAAWTSKLAAYQGMGAARPNILIITTDQQSADAASYRMGTRYLNTPNLDGLAATATAYTRAYCANPICVPSRTAMYTGRYPTETGVMDNEDRTTITLEPERYPLMGRVFSRGGYETAYFGKWHVPCPIERRDIHGFSSGKMSVAQCPDTETAANTAEFLRQRHTAPFLAVASFLNPHDICEWARGQKLPQGDLASPPPVNELPPQRANHAPQKNEPEAMTLARRSYQASPMFPVGGFDEKKWREYLWAYYRLIERVDVQIGVVLAALRDARLDGNTVVVFTADHGDCQGSHGWNQKTVFYEESVRVPLLIRRPDAKGGTVSERLVNTGIDLMPTVCGFAGLAAPVGLPGVSLKEAPGARRYVVASNMMTQGAAVDGRVPKPGGRMLRSDRYKYCVYSEGEHRESLVDLEKDPGEMVNVAGDARFRETLKQHRAMLGEWCGQTRDKFVVPGVS